MAIKTDDFVQIHFNPYLHAAQQGKVEDIFEFTQQKTFDKPLTLDILRVAIASDQVGIVKIVLPYLKSKLKDAYEQLESTNLPTQVILYKAKKVYQEFVSPLARKVQLELAARTGNLSAVQFLLQDKELLQQRGMFAIYHAQQAGHDAVREYIAKEFWGHYTV